MLQNTKALPVPDSLTEMVDTTTVMNQIDS